MNLIYQPSCGKLKPLSLQLDGNTGRVTTGKLRSVNFLANKEGRHLSKRFLITGCARSGTSHISQLISLAGCECRHELSGNQGMVCWFCCTLFDNNLNRKEPVTRCGCEYDGLTVNASGSIESSEARKLVDNFDLILHQLRHPLKVIASAQTLLPSSYDYIDKKIGISHYPNKILRATRYRIEWNIRASKLAGFSYKIEEISSRWSDITELLDLGSAHTPIDLLPQDINTRSHHDVSGEEIESMDRAPFDELREVAAGFGYSL